jgi:hypothetical protein
MLSLGEKDEGHGRYVELEMLHSRILKNLISTYYDKLNQNQNPIVLNKN